MYTGKYIYKKKRFVKKPIGCNKAIDCDWNLKICMDYVMFHSFIVDNIRKVGVIIDEKETPNEKNTSDGWQISNNTIPDIKLRGYRLDKD